MTDPKLIPSHGGYRELQSYKMADIVYDATIVFCDRFINIRSRTHDQMVQAARSGKQNIAEGSMVHQTNSLLDQQLRALEKAFLNDGDFTERLYRVRSTTRERGK